MLKITIILLFISQFTLLAEEFFTFPTDTNFYFSTRHEGIMASKSNLSKLENLQNIPMQLGDWKGESLAKKDFLVFHRYYELFDEEGEVNQALYFLAAHGKTEDLFHAGEVCYQGEGWKYEKRQIKTYKINGQKIKVRQVSLNKNGFKRIMLYWYFWPNTKRSISEGQTMFRLAIDNYDGEKITQSHLKNFMRELFNAEIKGSKPQSKNIIVQNDLKKLKQMPKHLKKTYQWLKGQMTPNEIVPNPHHKRRSMIISYKTDPTNSDFPYIFSKSSTYDNALAILAFTAVGDYQSAQKILDALWRNYDYDRKLYFSYNTHNAWPNLKDESGSVVRTGANSWVVSAIYKFLERMKEIYPTYLETENGNQYLVMANQLTEEMLKLQITNQKDRRLGLLLGGHGRYDYKKNKATGKVEEVYFDEKIEWASLEHNLDFYWQLKDYQKFNPQKKTNEAMELLKRGILAAYNVKTKQLNRGARKSYKDDKQALDASSWASVVIKDLGQEQLANTVLKSSLNYLTFKDPKKLFGHKPYINMLVFESYKVNSWMYPQTPNLNWNDVKISWGEGSYGVAVANYKLGKLASHKSMLQDLEWMTKPDGSVIYANKNIPFQFSNQGSVASSTWKIIAHYPDIIW